MLDLRRLQILREFSVRGTIAATAIALGYTPSAISQQLSTLERETGVALLDRTPRGAELTDAGRLLVVQAEEILALVEATESVLAEQSDVALGVVTVTAFPTAAVAFAPLLAPPLSRHEGMQLVLRQTLLSTSLAPGALVAWKVPSDRIRQTFDFMFQEDPFSGHVVTRSTDRETPGSDYKLWTTLKVPRPYSMEAHCRHLATRTGAQAFKLLPKGFSVLTLKI
jgi:DNA-binding transcriptional LysR family regulator